MAIVETSESRRVTRCGREHVDSGRDNRIRMKGAYAIKQSEVGLQVVAVK